MSREKLELRIEMTLATLKNTPEGDSVYAKQEESLKDLSEEYHERYGEYYKSKRRAE